MNLRFPLAIALMTVSIAACNKSDDSQSTPTFNIAKESYALPGDTLFPEGIAYQESTGHFYTGSTTTGDILKVNVENGMATMWAAGSAQGRKAATGLRLDAKKRLWICGGEDAKISVINESGALLKLWDMKAQFGAGFINDCISDGSYMYFTDSRTQKIYRAAVNSDSLGNMEAWLSFDNSQIPFVAGGTNANGIVLTPDGRYLIIVVSTSGKLYRIGILDKSITEITLNTPVTAGDGMLLEGTTLYVSRNATNQIWPVQMSNDYSQGSVGSSFGTGLLFNTTIARTGQYLLVVNGQLDKRATKNPVLPFTVRRISTP